MNLILMLTIISAICIVLISYLIKEHYKKEILKIKTICNQLEIKLEASQNTITQKEKLILDNQNQYTNNLDELRQDYNQRIEKIEKTHQNNIKLLEENYKNQNEILLMKNKNMLNEDSKKILEEIFNPLKDQVKNYTNRLMENETKIETQIKHVFEYSKNINENANNLVKTLKGDKKIRGNFGELQLKSVLENSGLIEGEQYRLQEQFKSDGNRYMPDAVIYLDKNRNIIVDAKFSLPNNFDFNEIDDVVCKEIASNLKNRIDELAKKPYPQMDTFTYDFVLLFIPYQNILDLAVSADYNLYQYAYSKKIYIATPNLLFLALKTIDITWRYNKSNDNAIKALNEIGKFYDKFVTVLNDFKSIQDAVKNINKHVGSMEAHLSSGNGNLSLKFERLRKLGLKIKKDIPENSYLNIEDNSSITL